MHLHAQTALIDNGFVHIPETGPWLDAYLHELTVFPNGKLMRMLAQEAEQRREAKSQGAHPVRPAARWNGKPCRKN
jgi:hypothetical protein